MTEIPNRNVLEPVSPESLPGPLMMGLPTWRAVYWGDAVHGSPESLEMARRLMAEAIDREAARRLDDADQPQIVEG